jgi:glycosyltransferase involved in cell wall biosynthesis
VATRLSIVVPTRNRPADIVLCVRSILATDGFIELIVVDQGDGRAVEDALAPLTDPRLRYVRTETRGVGAGRNVGLDSSRGDVIAYTDDDCRVSPDWPSAIIRAFEADPETAVVCGTVRVPPEIQHLGFAQDFAPARREWQGRYPPPGQWGITANFAVRRSAFARVGPFDPLLGAGAPLRSGGEPDFLYRVLRAGLKVVNAKEVCVDHYGIRKLGPEASTLFEGYGIGAGAAFTKYMRLGDLTAALVYARFVGSIARQVCATLIRTGRPTGAGFLFALFRGVRLSYKYGIDPQRQMYVDYAARAD